MDNQVSLPPAFADLQKFVAKWAQSTETERNRVRRHSTMAEIRALYEAAVPRLDDAMQYLNGFHLDAMPDEARALLRLTLAVMEIAPAVELYHQPDVIHAFDAERVEILVDPPI